MEKEYKISPIKIIIVLALFVLAILIISLAMPKKKSEGKVTSNYVSNITMMKEAGFEYFKGNNLPKNVGSSVELSLSDMLDNKLIMEIADENGKSCNLNESYVKVTKTLDNEYAMKVALSCEGKSDYIVTSIVGDKIVYVNNNSGNVSNSSSNSSNSGGNNSTSNGSNNYEPNVNKGSSSNNYSHTVNQITNVNINYVNNCGTCSGVNCNNNCLNNVYYTVTFDSNGGSYVPRQVVKSGDTANYATSYREGYTFLGWYLNDSLYNFNTPVVNTIVLVAKWQKNEKPADKNKYTVTFDSNGGSYIAPSTVLEGEYVSKPSNPTRSCYKFVAWHLGSVDGPVYYFSNPIIKDIKLVAEWMDDGSCHVPTKHTVTFDSNGGTYIGNQTVIDGNTAYNPGSPVKSCFRFDGWYTDRSFTNRYNFNSPVKNSMTLYAKWVDDGSCNQNYSREYTVRFDSNGGTYIGSQTVNEGSYAYNPGVPVRNGYTFKGWYYNGSLFNFNTRIYRNYTLTAMWEVDEVKYNKYCKIDSKRYYSTTYVSANHNSWNYNWQIRFDELRNIQDLKITNVGYISGTSMYTALYNDFVYGKGISSPSTSNKYVIAPPNANVLMNASLKSNNFNKSLSGVYYSGGYWYTTAYINIYNYNNVSYYASGLGNIHFVPFYFDVSYTNLDNCVEDRDSNSYRYSGYKIVSSYYR